MADNDMLFDGIENALDYLYDIISGATFGNIDDTVEGEKARRAGLAQIEMVLAALSVLRKNIQEDTING